MSEHVKCFTGNYDGRRAGAVIARSQKQAAEIAKCSLYEFRQYWGRSSFINGLKPYTLYTRSYSLNGESPWIEGICDISQPASK